MNAAGLTKIQRFLLSLGLEDIDRFDMSFVLAARNPYNRNQVDMAIEKSSPWSYALLDEFIQASSTIQYPYTLRFSYSTSPTEEDVAALFYDWYFQRYAAMPSFTFEKKTTGQISVGYPDAESQNRNQRAIKDFRDLLKFINYDFV